MLDILVLFIIILQDKGEIMARKKAKEVIVTQSSDASNHTSESRKQIRYYEENDSTISFMYHEDNEHHVHLTFDLNQLAIMRIGASKTFCWFALDTETPLLKDDEVGTLLLSTKTKTYIYENDIVSVEYDLYMNEDKIDTIKMTWEIIKQ